MSDLAIRVENLSKRYHIGTHQRGYKTLRESLTTVFTAPFRRLAWREPGNRRIGEVELLGSPVPRFPDSQVPRLPDYQENNTFWALKDVSFSVAKGEVVGIIGRNGAGKSTLLKILSRITKPTEGGAEIRGRVGSLLEVGTGFHPELTGRENIYLNAAILGMKRVEIDRKFDEIVAFSEVERFIDTPVKHYSSGMYVRLAFSVAAHMESEILLVDEVLAVGDLSFQRKCLNKMQDVGHQGRTVFFVSHNMPAITRLCPRTILLSGGQISRDGPSHQVVGAYLGSGLGTTAHREWGDPSKAPGDDIVRLLSVRVTTEDGQTTAVVDIRKPVAVEVEYEVLKPGTVLVPNLHFYNEEGVYAFVSGDCDPNWRIQPRSIGHYVSTAWIPGNLLTEGTLIVGAAMSTMNPVVVHFYERDAVAFQVVDSTDGDSARGDYAGPMPGVVRPLLRWTTRYRESHEGHPLAPTEEILP
jgi:lipopolysaccharide transport system ATP-binding protein